MQTPRRALVVSIHDVSPLTRDSCCNVRRPCCGGSGPMPLLVIPNHHNKAPIGEDAEFCDWLRAAAQRTEIVFHGYFHQRPAKRRRMAGRLMTEHYTAGEGEFYDLTEGEARCRLERGRREFRRNSVWFREGSSLLRGFLGAEAERAVSKVGIRLHDETPQFQGSCDTAGRPFRKASSGASAADGAGCEHLLERLAGAQALPSTALANRLASAGLAARKRFEGRRWN